MTVTNARCGRTFSNLPDLLSGYLAILGHTSRSRLNTRLSENWSFAPHFYLSSRDAVRGVHYIKWYGTLSFPNISLFCCQFTEILMTVFTRIYSYYITKCCQTVGTIEGTTYTMAAKKIRLFCFLSFKKKSV